LIITAYRLPNRQAFTELPSLPKQIRLPVQEILTLPLAQVEAVAREKNAQGPQMGRESATSAGNPELVGSPEYGA